MSIDYGNPPQAFLRDHELNDTTGVQCRECLHAATACRCDIMCCETCGNPRVLIAGADILDEGSTECPLCDRIPSNNKPAALFQAGTHPVFSGGNWMARVAAEVDRCGFDGCVVHEVDETTARIEPETMAQTVSR